MFSWLYDHVPHQDLIVVHAHLPGADWEGTIEHIQHSTNEIPVFIVQANKTFFEMVERRGMWPAPAYRQCTSDLKTAPISKFIRKYSRENGYATVFNCIGLRAEESTDRRKKPVIKVNKKLTAKFRKVFNVLPIHDYTVKQVFASNGLGDLQRRRALYRLGRKTEALQDWPFIWTYVAGMSRHSCKLCIMAKRSDLACSARLDPENLDRYIQKERQINHKFIIPGKSTPSLEMIRKNVSSQQLEIL